MSKEGVTRFNKQHLVVGLKETLKALEKDQVTSLIIAKDVEVYLMTRMLSRIDQKNMPVSFFKSKHALDKHVGISIDATIVALIRQELVSV